MACESGVPAVGGPEVSGGPQPARSGLPDRRDHRVAHELRPPLALRNVVAPGCLRSSVFMADPLVPRLDSLGQRRSCLTARSRSSTSGAAAFRVAS
jgi:hypothetical protein